MRLSVLQELDGGHKGDLIRQCLPCSDTERSRRTVYDNRGNPTTLLNQRLSGGLDETLARSQVHLLAPARVGGRPITCWVGRNGLVGLDCSRKDVNMGGRRPCTSGYEIAPSLS